MLFNHLAYAAMRSSDQGFVTLDQLLSSTELGTFASNATDGTVPRSSFGTGGATGDAYVATVSQQLVDRLPMIVVSSLEVNRQR